MSQTWRLSPSRSPRPPASGSVCLTADVRSADSHQSRGSLPRVRSPLVAHLKALFSPCPLRSATPLIKEQGADRSNTHTYETKSKSCGLSGASEVETPKERKTESRLMGFIRKPQVLAGKEPTDTIDALISQVRADTILPSRLVESATEVRRSIDAAIQMYKPEVLRDLVKELGPSGTQKRFANVALHTARAQLKDFMEKLENDGRRFAEAKAQYDAAWSALEEEQAPMMEFLTKHATSDERVTSLGEQLKKYTEAMEGAKEEIDSLGALISSSKDSVSQLEKDIEAAAKGYSK